MRAWGALLLLCACKGPTLDVATVCGAPADLPWANPHLVSVTLPDGGAYDDNVEEPEVRDFGGERWLFFNDDPANGNKDLRYARWDANKQSFVVLGLLPGPDVQTAAVDGNPSLDQNGHFYFVSARSYPNPNDSIYSATLTVSGSPATAALSNVTQLLGLTHPGAPWLSQGVQVTWDGAWLYFDDAKFGGPVPTESDIIAAKWNGAAFVRLADAEQTALLGNVNTSKYLEYAETISRDGKEMYFTRTWADAAQLDKAVMCVMRSTRPDAAAPFGVPVNVGITAPGPGILMEAPSLSPDEKTLYYHRRAPGDPVARLYAVERP